jgi:aldehyde dehydrogenase
MIGAQASPEPPAKIRSALDPGRKEGADCLIGGERNRLAADLRDGGSIPPTVFKGPKRMRIVRAGIFGPVVSVTTVKDMDEALSIAHETLFGLGADVWSREANSCQRMDRAIQAGRVWTICYHASAAHAAFGGYEQSLIGRETHTMMLEHDPQTENLPVSSSAKALGFF